MNESQYPMISVIVPVYKVESYLERCINSLINQTYKNMDIILVDDGSPDCCPKMCDQFAEHYSNITALHKKNGGLSDARNFGVKFSNNEWIIFVDSDDYVEPIYVETLVNLQKQYDAEMVITRTVRENENGGGKPKHQQFNSYLCGKKTALFKVYSGIDVGWAAYGKLYQKRYLLKHPFPIGYFEDCACMYKIIDEVDKIAIGDYEENYHYIQRDGSILNSGLNEKHMIIFDIAREFEKFINEKYPDLDILIVSFYRRAVTQLLNLQKMSWNIYKSIFFKYRSYFRKNAKKVIRTREFSFSTKIHFLLLCSRPELFYVQRYLLEKSRCKIKDMKK